MAESLLHLSHLGCTSAQKHLNCLTAVTLPWGCDLVRFYDGRERQAWPVFAGERRGRPAEPGEQQMASFAANRRRSAKGQQLWQVRSLR